MHELKRFQRRPRFFGRAIKPWKLRIFWAFWAFGACGIFGTLGIVGCHEEPDHQVVEHFKYWTGTVYCGLDYHSFHASRDDFNSHKS